MKNILFYVFNILIITYVFQGMPYGSYLLPFSLIPWFVKLNKLRNIKGLLLHSVFLQVLFAFNTMSWVPAPSQTLLGKSLLTSWLLYFFLSPLVTLFIPIYVFLRQGLRKFNFNLIAFSFLSATLYYFLDKHFVFLDVSFGYYVHHVPELLAIAKYFGAFSITFCIVFSSELSASLYETLGKRRYILTLLPGIGFIFCSFVLYETSFNSAKHSRKLNIVLGQTNYGPKELFKIYDKNQELRSYKHYEELISKLEQSGMNFKNHLLALPESFFPPYYLSPDNSKTEEMYLKLVELRKKYNISLLAGAIWAENEHRYNVVSYEHNKQRDIYRKVFLMPFGEAVPGAKFFPFLYSLFYKPYINSRGSHLRVFEFNKLKFVPLICSEIFNNKLISAIHNKDVDFIFHIGNEAWLLDSIGKNIIFMINKIRALETGVPIVKLANTGKSGVFDSNGNVELEILPNEVNYLNLDVYLGKAKRTFYAKNKNTIDWILNIWGLLVICLAVFGEKVVRRWR